MSEIRQYVSIGLKWWWLLLIGLIVGGGIGYIVEQSKTPTYRTKTTLLIGNSTDLFNPNPNAIATSQRLAQNYGEMIKREAILEAVVDSLEWETNWSSLSGKLSSRLVPNTQLFEIYVTDTDPQRARLLADAVAQQLINQSLTEPAREQQWYRDFIRSQIDDLQGKILNAQEQVQDIQAALEIETTASGINKRQEELTALNAKIDRWQNNYVSLLNILESSDTTSLVVVEPATLPTSPTGATTSRRNILVAAAVGLALAFGLAYLIEFIDDRVKTADDVQETLGLPTLGTVPQIRMPKRSQSSQNSSLQESPLATESYRALRTNLQFSNLLLTEEANSLLVTSSGIGEGKSTTAANLAIVMAYAGKEVILVDADLRRPTIHRTFGLPNELGLTNLLLDEAISLEKALVETKVNRLQILPSGPAQRNAADFLGLPRMAEILKQLTQRSDIVIIDSPPLLVVTDASILATRAGATLLVIDAGKTRRHASQRAIEILKQVGANTVGVVLNKFDPKRDSRYYGYGYYNYYYYGYTDNGKSEETSQKRRSVKG